MSGKKDLIYQVVIAVLLVVVAFAFYKLYRGKEVEPQPKMVLDIDNSVDIKVEKPKYKPVELKYKPSLNSLHKLNYKLAELDASYQKSVEMINEYNFEHPDSPIEVDMDVDLDIPILSKPNPYTSLDIESRYEQHSHRVEEFLNKHSSIDTSSLDRTSSSGSQSKDSSMVSSIGVVSSGLDNSSDSTTLGGSFVYGSSGTESIPEEVNTRTTYVSVDSDIEKYSSSIAEVQTLMNKIRANLE